MHNQVEIIIRTMEKSGNVVESVIASFPSEEVKRDDNRICFTNLEIQLQTQAVYLNGRSVPFTHNEFFVLVFMAKHPNWVFTKEQIYEAVWNECSENCGSAVTNVISQIRRKIGKEYIKTVVGSGYKFVDAITER